MKTLCLVCRTMLVVTALISVYSLCYAQQRGPMDPEARAEMIKQRVEALDKELNLTDDQAEKILNLLMEPRQAGQRGAGGGMVRMMGRMGSNPAIEKILTPEQQEKYRAYNRKQRIDSQLNPLIKQLELTKDQQAKIRKILNDSDDKTQKLFAEMQDSNVDRQTIFSQMREQREQTDKEIQALLTEEQAKIFSTMERRMRGRRR
ncbi:hypothetical protein ACFL1R_10535 [Candidatus Latescibacterota bacterium]